MKNILLILSLLAYCTYYGQREIWANKKTEDIILDGSLNERDWNSANWTSNFTQMKPFPGERPSQKTAVALIYDQEAIKGCDLTIEKQTICCYYRSNFRYLLKNNQITASGNDRFLRLIELILAHLFYISLL